MGLINDTCSLLGPLLISTIGGHIVGLYCILVIIYNLFICMFNIVCLYKVIWYLLMFIILNFFRGHKTFLLNPFWYCHNHLITLYKMQKIIITTDSLAVLLQFLVSTFGLSLYLWQRLITLCSIRIRVKLVICNKFSSGYRYVTEN